MLLLEKLSLGVGDRFAHQAKAQLRAFQKLASQGVHAVPVWNKSNREHTFIGSEPKEVLAAAQGAVQSLSWKAGWHVDGDHIRLQTVDRFVAYSDFFTIDVADSIGQPAPVGAVEAFVDRHPEFLKPLQIQGIEAPFHTSPESLTRTVSTFYAAAQEAGLIYHHIARVKGGEQTFIAEVSLDETEAAQTPPELLVILCLLADNGVRPQTIAPKFNGRFNKGVDYVGDLVRFDREFNDDIAVLAHAVQHYGLPENLKLSVHSGSDKFSLYPVIQRALRRTGAGLHLKTAGTTWLEELVGLAESGGEGLAMVKDIYASALDHVEELCAPYASVIDVDRARLPDHSVVRAWRGDEFASALRHIPTNPRFNPHFRQLLHVAFKLAAKRGKSYLDLLEAHEEIVGNNVTENIFQRHMRPLFLS